MPSNELDCGSGASVVYLYWLLLGVFVNLDEVNCRTREVEVQSPRQILALSLTGVLPVLSQQRRMLPLRQDNG